MEMTAGNNKWMERLARIGLGAKGFVYVMVGLLAFMAAFEIAGHTNNDADQEGAMLELRNLPGGGIILALLTGGLLCYSIWRLAEAFSSRNSGRKKARYVLSALSYLSVAFVAWQVMMHQYRNGSGQHWSRDFIYDDWGKIAVMAIAVFMAGSGLYQIWYGFSSKYKKRFSGGSLPASSASILLRSGKIGYVSRGIVWLIISYMLSRAVFMARASEAGDTASAFGFVESSSYGSYLLGALGLGLTAFGVFNFLRAGYENFNNR